MGDSRRMGELEDGSVHLVVTSPPYWQLKDYGPGGQIGFHDSYEDYINNLNLVWSECIRVLHPGCRLCINIGDQFARSVYYGRYKVIPIRTEIIKFCEIAGLDYMGAVIWRKVTTCNTTGGATIMGSFPYPRNGILKIDYEFILIFKKPGKAPGVPPGIKEKAKLTAGEWNEYFSGHWTFPGEKQKGRLAAFPEELPRRLTRMFTFEGETVLDPFLGSGTTSLAAMKLGRDSVGYEISEAFLPVIQGRLLPASCRHLAIIETEIQDPLNIDFGAQIRKLPYVFADPLRLDRRTDPRKLGYGSVIDGQSTEKRELFSVREILPPGIIVLDDGRRVGLLGVKWRDDKGDEAVDFLRAKTRGQKVFLRAANPMNEARGQGAGAEDDRRGGRHRRRRPKVAGFPPGIFAGTIGRSEKGRGGLGQNGTVLRGRGPGTTGTDDGRIVPAPGTRHAAPDSDNIIECYVYLKNRTFLNAHLIKRGLAEADDSVDHHYSGKFRSYQKL